MSAPAPSLDERAQKSGVSRDAKDPYVDDGNPDRVFNVRIKPYIEPKDCDSMDETKRVDEENTRRHEFNLTQLPVLTIIFRRAGQSTFKLPKPPIYHDRAKQLYLNKINEPAFKTLEAMRFLLARNKRFGVDFTIETAVQKAEEFVDQEFFTLQRRKGVQRIDIKDAAGVPSNHHTVCNCNYTWDGVSANCAGTGQRLRMTWRTKTPFHFLMPEYEPFAF